MKIIVCHNSNLVAKQCHTFIENKNLKQLLKNFLLLICCFFYCSSQAQEKKVAPTSKQLFLEIAKQDSALFVAYNNRDIEKMKTFFTEDLEWYQDNGGLLNFTAVMSNFENIFSRPYRLVRTLVKGTLEVHPIKGFGAIEIGSHQFTHTENGKEETGTFKFLMLWKQTAKGWQISRVFSYDH